MDGKSQGKMEGGEGWCVMEQRAGRGRAGQCMVGLGRIGQGRARQGGRAGYGRTGQGSAVQSRVGKANGNAKDNAGHSALQKRQRA